MFVSTLIAFLVYWLLIFVVNYIVVEYGQNYLYDEPTPHFAAKVLGGSCGLAVLATILRPSFDTMFTNSIHWTALQAVAWVLVFMLLYEFHPPHALLIGLIAMVTVPGLATMTSESLTRPRVVTAPPSSRPTGPIRRPAAGPTPIAPAPAPAPK